MRPYDTKPSSRYQTKPANRVYDTKPGPDRYDTKPELVEIEFSQMGWIKYSLMLIGLIVGCVAIFFATIAFTHPDLVWGVMKALVIDRFSIWASALVVGFGVLFIVAYIAKRKLGE
jgi:hypothetical protein